MIDTDGDSHTITFSTVSKTLGIGWAAFGLSLIFNILYYALHPSDVTRLQNSDSESANIFPPG